MSWLTERTPGTIKMEVMDEKGNPTGFHLHVVGPESSQALEQGRYFIERSKKNNGEFPVSELRDYHVNSSAALIVGWCPKAAEAFEMEYSPENAKKLTSVEFIRNQVLSLLQKNDLFFRVNNPEGFISH